MCNGNLCPNIYQNCTCGSSDFSCDLVSLAVIVSHFGPTGQQMEALLLAPAISNFLASRCHPDLGIPSASDLHCLIFNIIDLPSIGMAVIRVQSPPVSLFSSICSLWMIGLPFCFWLVNITLNCFHASVSCLKPEFCSFPIVAVTSSSVSCTCALGAGPLFSVACMASFSSAAILVAFSSPLGFIFGCHS